MAPSKLVMRFDPNTIEHLGVKMYSQVPTAIAELIANSYDADAKKVIIRLVDDEDGKKIVVEDDGVGMTFKEINDEFLVIGRNRREEGKTKSPSGKRRVTGKKGLGKLALFGIGDTIDVITNKDGQKVHFRMNWGRLKQTTGADYAPEIVSIEKCDKESGTIIILSDLKRKSPFDEHALAISLSKLFNFFDRTFTATIIKDEKQVIIDNELKYSDLKQQFNFSFPDYATSKDIQYQYKQKISGVVISTETPLRPGLRGITLYANGRLVNAPEFYGRSESSHFYSYITGWLNVDFVDNWKEDVISTNRQSLNWEQENTKALRDFLEAMILEIQKDWRQKRTELRRNTLSEKLSVDINEWYGKLPSDVLPKVESVVNSIETSELSVEDQTKTVANIHALIPEYPYYHWRHLHSGIQGASEAEYQSGDYYRAFLEAAKRYINEVRSKSGRDGFKTDQTMMAEVFGNNRILLLVQKYRKRNGEEFSGDTVTNIQNGQQFLSSGIVAGGRNPLSHEEIAELKASGLFSEKDCLDLLSCLSHLFRRLDDAERNGT